VSGPPSGSLCLWGWMMSEPMYRWDVTVRNWDRYGDKVVSKFSASILAANRSEVTEKVRTMFGATYDDFRKFWSHDAVINSVCEQPLPSPQPVGNPDLFEQVDQQPHDSETGESA